MILVTGAAGKTGQSVLQALVSRGASVRAMVRHPEQANALGELGPQEIVAGDLRRVEDLRSAVQGARAVYHICPNVHPDELVIGKNLIAAAEQAGIEHFVYHSVMHPQIEAMPHHWLKMRVEEGLFQSGLPFTILQPAAYMQNILAKWDMIVEKGVLLQPYSGERRGSLVDLEDVAQAAAIVLTEPGHSGATYELAGDACTQIEFAAVLSGQLGREVRFERLPLDQWIEQARLSGLGAYQIETLTKMFCYYDDYEFIGNPNILGWLLDRKPTNLVKFIDRIAV